MKGIISEVNGKIKGNVSHVELVREAMSKNPGTKKSDAAFRLYHNTPMNQHGEYRTTLNVWIITPPFLWGIFYLLLAAYLKISLDNLFQL